MTPATQPSFELVDDILPPDQKTLRARAKLRRRRDSTDFGLELQQAQELVLSQMRILPNVPKAGKVYPEWSSLGHNLVARRVVSLIERLYQGFEGLFAVAYGGGAIFGTAAAIQTGCHFFPLQSPDRVKDPHAVSEEFTIDYAGNRQWASQTPLFGTSSSLTGAEK